MNKIYTNNAPEAIGPYSQAVECGGSYIRPDRLL